MVTDFSAAEKDSSVKLRVLVPLLSEMSFSHFGELWPRGGSLRSLYANCTSEKSHLAGKNTNHTWEKIVSRLGGQSVLGAVWWDMQCVLLANALV